MAGVPGTNSDAEMHDKAVELIRDVFDTAARMRSVDRKAVNRPRPAKLRYSSHADLVRDFVDSAGAMPNFAAQLGLITQNEAIAILRRTRSAHPELDKWLMT